MNVWNEKGLTLVEAMAATVILSLVVITFLNISGYSTLSNQKSDRRVEAQNIAEEQLSSARDYVRINNGLPANPSVPGYSVTIQQTDLGNPAAYNTTTFQPNHVSLQAVVLLSGIPKLLTVTVSWSG